MTSDPVKVMVENLKTLHNAKSSVEEKEAALENLNDFCEDVDLANGKQKN